MGPIAGTRMRKALPCLLAACLWAWMPMAAAWAADLLPAAWPDPASLAGERVTFPSHSPYTLADISPVMEPTLGHGLLFMPAAAARPVPAVVLLHGAGGISPSRELTYARQFAAMGVAALVVDAFGARRDRWDSFITRLLAVTETMVMADAYAALHHLSSRPDIDTDRTALIGFSYGGMASLYSAYEAAAGRLAGGTARFAAHVSFYAPCIAAFERNETTGAPVLMLMGGRDAIIDLERCRATAMELRAGGSDVAFTVYENAYHQWDSNRSWHPRRGLADCRLTVEADGSVRDARTRIWMTGFYSRAAILSLCSDSDGYQIRGDPAIRARSNAALAAFLNRVWFGAEAPRPGEPRPMARPDRPVGQAGADPS